MNSRFFRNFIDYGNSDNVVPPNIVKYASDIPKSVPDYNVDEYVGNRMTKVEDMVNVTESYGKSVIVKDVSMIPEDDEYIDENVNDTLVPSENNNAEESYHHEETFDEGWNCQGDY